MPAGPQRRKDPAPHLGPHIVPLELALRHRADVLEAESTRVGPTSLLTLQTIAAEFRALADEMHHW